MAKLLNLVLDTLMFLVPILELSQATQIIPPDYLPYYMLGTVFLRRATRLLEDYLKKEGLFDGSLPPQD